MLRTYLPLLPLPVLAVIFAVAACSRPRSEEPIAHLIPPAAAWEAPVSAPEAKPTVAAAPAPSDEDVKEFERVVPK